MEKMFCMGLAIGLIGGALVVANSHKARTLVKKSQDEVMQKVDSVMDEKLKEFSKKQESGSYGGDMQVD